MFCRRPFFAAQLNASGTVNTCCPGWMSVSIGNWRKESLDEIWHSQTAKEVRESILDGSFRFCDREACPVIQNPGHPAQRREGFEQNIKEPRLQHIALNVEGSCNLRCPSCRKRPAALSTVADDHPMMRLSRDIVKLFNEQDRITLVMSGAGEPMVQKTSEYVLQNIQKSAANQKNNIHIVTNGTLLARRWPEFWRANDFHCTCAISIDAASKKTYETNRRGGKWHDVLMGIAFAVGTFRHVALTCVVQANNFREAPRLIGMGETFGCDAVRFSMIRNWGTYSEEEYKQRAVHMKDHPQHEEFVRLFNKLSSKHLEVDLTNLHAIVRGR